MNDPDPSLGAYRLWLRALAECTKSPCDYILILEDDLQLSGGLAEYFGWIPAPTTPDRVVGSHAYAMTLDMARQFLESPPPAQSFPSADQAVADWGRSHQVLHYVHAPSFAVQRGETSTSADADIPQRRQCRRWIESISISFTEKFIRSRAQVIDMKTLEASVIHQSRDR
ncbi:MAG: hypothetical protein U0939_17685 [Pirellulales bacterium]